MITAFYPSEKRKTSSVRVTVYSGGGSAAAEKATKLGITIAEYWRRKNLVQKERADCSFKLGDKVYPTKLKDFRRHGEMQIVGICNDYDHYGTVDWNDPPFILSVRDNFGNSVQCTRGWVSFTEPVDPTENLGVC